MTTENPTREGIEPLSAHYQLACGNGYGFIELVAEDEWEPIAAWGVEGWDLGVWPLVVVVAKVIVPEPGDEQRWPAQYGAAVYIEGDVECLVTDDWAAWEDWIAAKALWFWRHGGVDGPPDLAPEGETPAPEHVQPFDWPLAPRPTS
jgi:hypothetical protein